MVNLRYPYMADTLCVAVKFQVERHTEIRHTEDA